MPQLFEIDVGQIDRGAKLDWISYFPGEEEVRQRLPHSCKAWCSELVPLYACSGAAVHVKAALQ
jgi:hypothetical protein